MRVWCQAVLPIGYALMLGLLAMTSFGCVSGRDAASAADTSRVSNRNVPPAECTTLGYYYAGIKTPYRSKPEWLFVKVYLQDRMLFNRVLDSLALREVRDGELLGCRREPFKITPEQFSDVVRSEGGIYLTRRDGLPFSRTNCQELVALRSCPYVYFAGPTVVSLPNYVSAYSNLLYIEFFNVPDSAALISFLHQHHLDVLPGDGAVPHVDDYSRIPVLAPEELGEGLWELADQINRDENVRSISYDFIKSMGTP